MELLPSPAAREEALRPEQHHPDQGDAVQQVLVLHEVDVLEDRHVERLEELVEQMTWQQLGRHTKPVLLANIDNFWEPLLVLLTHMRATEFIRPALNIDILKAERVEDILPRLRAAAARAGTKELAPEVARRL